MLCLSLNTYYHSLHTDGLEINATSYTFNLCHVTYVAAHFQEKNKMLIRSVKYTNEESGKIH